MSKRKKDEFKSISVVEIADNPHNPRTITAKSPGMTELIASVKASGVLQPVMVRGYQPTKLATHKCRYQLLAGSRRLCAAQEANVKAIPAIVKYGLTDEQAFEITMIENWHENLTPMENARAAQILLEKYKGDAKAAASRIGKSEKWIRTRARIENHLSKKWKEYLKEHPQDDWTAGHLALIARLPETIQKKLWEDVRWDLVPTIAELEKEIQDYLRTLDKAPWELDDETLVPKAGSCATCSKQTCKQPGLWDWEDGVVAEEAKVAKSRCLDPACYHRKMLAYIQGKQKELSKEHKNLAVVATKHFDYHAEYQEHIKQFPGLLRNNDFHKVNKTDKKAVPALVVHGKDIGKVIYIRKGSKSAPAAKSSPHGSGVTTLKERRRRLDSKRWCQLLRDLREKLEEIDFEEQKEICNRDTFILVAIFGTEESFSHVRDVSCYGEKKAASEKILWNVYWDYAEEEDGVIRGEIAKRLWLSVRPVLASRLTSPGGVTQLDKAYIEEAKNVGKLIGVDVEAMFKTVSESKGFTEPKSWQDLKADGTPKAPAGAGVPKKVKSKKAKGKRQKGQEGKVI